jgi:hypothetical protein
MHLQDLYIEPSKTPKHECFKQCSCGEQYTKEQWMLLEPPSSGGSEWDTGDGIILVLRLCKSCRSTMSYEKTE